MLRDLVLKNRSYRRFDQEDTITETMLREWVDLARQTPSGANFQSLKYALAFTTDKNAAIYPHLAWAGYLCDWDGPEAAERPTAYVTILGDRTVAKDFGCDHGIAAQTILLAAAEQGFGGCMIGSVKRDALLETLELDGERFEVLLVLALGKPKETVVLEPLGDDGSIKYYRDAAGVHHVPKRGLDEVILSD
jgi:nitroreductase